MIYQNSKPIKDKEENKTTFNLDFNNIYVLGGFSIGGFILFCITFYIAWKCWLRDKLEEILLNYCCGEWGEKIMDVMEIIGFVEEWREKKEKKDDMKEYYGLTPKQIAICKEAKEINKIKYEEAVKIRWDKISQQAVRPEDEYHKALFKNITKQKNNIELSVLNEIENNIKDENNIIENTEDENYIISVLPGTPRRRRKVVRI